MAFKNIAVVGGSGLIGKPIVNALITSPHNYTVTVLTREQSSTAPSGATTTKVDYNNHATLVDALKGQDVVVSAIATPATPEQIKIIDAAVEAGVKRFVPAEFGVDTTYPGTVDRFPGFKLKQDVREYLDGKIEWTAFATGPFFDGTFQRGFLGFDISSNTASFDPKYRANTFSASNLDFIGRAVAQALAPSIAPKTANKLLYVRSFTVSQDALLAEVERITGKEWKVETISFEELTKDAREKLKNNDFSRVGALIQDVIFDSATGNDWDIRGVTSNELLELPDKEDLEATLRRVLAA
ncbi:hypothetical protein ASPWEDRAFT_37741 [Aspergillus wentii DTO 134E9]|uniref:NmrA-like domain-containing protein n=1 Tax=Aspergillus wentii DTO 134E9 TaxID=1073089 RepID=A0A1L9RYB7_ASPWE|nr:uncharacterized protein ASPWEDRAFT_37741 [Aspergillus wentii DTO 134E9]KAI9931457.1 hypothetical protein MW887_010032 [Aspergillus wentii]OJJ39874.1 hypothetical protein ASPWEDRAFT_37741 [Aspergillus wentii DTO 134E9]